MIKTNNYLKLNVVLALLFCHLFFWADISKAETVIPLSKGQTVYVPIYSHIYSGNKEHPFYLAATLSIRNTDPKTSLLITSVDYYDSEGKILENYLQGNRTLKPMASTRFIIKEFDKAGGSGAKFIVRWEADKNIIPPLIESIMIGTQTQQGISFTSRGIIIEEK